MSPRFINPLWCRTLDQSRNGTIVILGSDRNIMKEVREGRLHIGDMIMRVDDEPFKWVIDNDCTRSNRMRTWYRYDGPLEFARWTGIKWD